MTGGKYAPVIVAVVVLSVIAFGQAQSAANDLMEQSLADLLMHLNDLLVEDTDGEGFMTMLLMTVDARRKEMRWATAGHEVPVIYDPELDEFIELRSHGMVLGFEKNNAYHEETFTDVKPGQIFLALTDGLWETFNKDGEMFGMERVQDMIRRHAYSSADEISQQIIQEMIAFRG